MIILMTIHEMIRLIYILNGKGVSYINFKGKSYIIKINFIQKLSGIYRKVLYYKKIEFLAFFFGFLRINSSR